MVLHEAGPLANYLSERSIPYKQVFCRWRWDQHKSAVGRGRAILAPARRLAATLRRQRCTIVHTNDVRMHVLWSGPARLAGANHLWHQRSRYAASCLTRLALLAAQQVVCISQFSADTMPAFMRRSAIVAPNPFVVAAADRARARAAMLAACAAPPNAVVVGFVANLTLQKRPAQFIAAAQWLALALPGPVVFPLLGADRDGLEPELRQQAAMLKIGERVKFLGFKDPIEPWLAGCDLLLVPAVEDAFGRTLVEAMAVGTPVVATNSGGHPEIVVDGHTGLLVPTDDPAAMATAALRVLQGSGLAARLTETARAIVVPRYSLVSHVAAMTSIYQEITTSHES